MGLFGFIGEVVSASVKVAVAPVAILRDVADVAIGEEPKNTKRLIQSAGKDLEKGMDEITGNTF